MKQADLDPVGKRGPAQTSALLVDLNRQRWAVLTCEECGLAADWIVADEP